MTLPTTPCPHGSAAGWTTSTRQPAASPGRTGQQDHEFWTLNFWWNFGNFWLIFQFKFTYKETFGNGLTEYETDHVYFGLWDGTPKPNIDEVSDYKWVNVHDLIRDVKRNPKNYTYWFKHIIQNFEEKIINNHIEQALWNFAKKS